MSNPAHKAAVHPPQGPSAGMLDVHVRRLGVWGAIVAVATSVVLTSCTRLNPLFGISDDNVGDEAPPDDSASAESTEAGATSSGGSSGDGSSGGGSSSGGSSGGSGSDDESSGPGDDDTSADGESSSGDPTQGAGGPELCGYSAATAVFISDAEPVANLSGVSTDERDPFVVEGGETMYFWRSDDIAAAIPRGVYVAQAEGDGFGVPTRVPDFAPANEVLKLALSADGLEAVIAAAFDGTFNLWQLERDGRANAFDVSGAVRLFELELSPPVFDPHLSGDALHLFFAPQFGAGDQALYVSQRADAASPFDSPLPLTELDFAPTREADPTVTADLRVIMFTVDDYVVGPRLWTASRDDDGVFVDARDLGDLGRVGELRDPHLSADGCDLWYINAEAGTFDIWHAVAAPGE